MASLLLSALHRTDALVRATGLRPISLDPEALIATARRAVEGPLPDGAWRAGLERLTTSLDGEARLNLLGRYHGRTLVLEALITRIRLQQARETRAPLQLPHPPLVICGPPRSGTTFLHRCLAAIHPGSTALPFWRLIDPLSPASEAVRLRRAGRRLRGLSLLAPELDAQHLLRADLPDECGHLLKPAFLSTHCWQLPVHGFVDHLLTADGAEAYHDYRDLLALIAPDRPLVLKDPFHIRHLDALFAVAPGTKVIQTWRDPAEVVPSFHKLVTTVQRLFTDQLDLERSVELSTELLIDTAARARTHHHERVVQIAYPDLITDPAEAIRTAHERLSLPLDPAADAALDRFVQAHPHRAHGPNPYRPEDFGQTANGIRDRFEAAGVPCP